MVSTPKFSVLLLALAASHALAAPPGPPPGAPALFCCVHNGRSVCADSFPEQCRGKPYRVLDSKGNLLKEVGPPMSAEQKAAAEAAEKQAKDQKRQDQALLDTYSNVKEVDLARERAEALHNTAIINAEAQIDVLQKKRKKLETEAKAGGPAAPQIARELKTNAEEMKAQEDIRDSRKREVEAVRAKYEADRKRYLELSGRNGG